MQKADSLAKTLILGKIEGRRGRGWQRMRWLNSITDSIDRSLSKFREILKGTVHGVSKSQTWLSNFEQINPRPEKNTKNKTKQTRMLVWNRDTIDATVCFYFFLLKPRTLLPPLKKKKVSVVESHSGLMEGCECSDPSSVVIVTHGKSGVHYTCQTPEVANCLHQHPLTWAWWERLTLLNYIFCLSALFCSSNL